MLKEYSYIIILKFESEIINIEKPSIINNIEKTYFLKKNENYSDLIALYLTFKKNQILNFQKRSKKIIKKLDTFSKSNRLLFYIISLISYNYTNKLLIKKEKFLYKINLEKNEKSKIKDVYILFLIIFFFNTNQLDKAGFLIFTIEKFLAKIFSIKENKKMFFEKVEEKIKFFKKKDRNRIIFLTLNYFFLKIIFLRKCCSEEKSLFYKKQLKKLFILFNQENSLLKKFFDENFIFFNNKIKRIKKVNFRKKYIFMKNQVNRSVQLIPKIMNNSRKEHKIQNSEFHRKVPNFIFSEILNDSKNNCSLKHMKNLKFRYLKKTKNKNHKNFSELVKEKFENQNLNISLRNTNLINNQRKLKKKTKFSSSLRNKKNTKNNNYLKKIFYFENLNNYRKNNIEKNKSEFEFEKLKQGVPFCFNNKKSELIEKFLKISKEKKQKIISLKKKKKKKESLKKISFGNIHLLSLRKIKNSLINNIPKLLISKNRLKSNLNKKKINKNFESFKMLSNILNKKCKSFLSFEENYVKNKNLDKFLKFRKMKKLKLKKNYSYFENTEDIRIYKVIKGLDKFKYFFLKKYFFGFKKNLPERKFKLSQNNNVLKNNRIKKKKKIVNFLKDQILLKKKNKKEYKINNLKIMISYKNKKSNIFLNYKFIFKKNISFLISFDFEIIKKKKILLIFFLNEKYRSYFWKKYNKITDRLNFLLFWINKFIFLNKFIQDYKKKKKNNFILLNSIILEKFRIYKNLISKLNFMIFKKIDEKIDSDVFYNYLKLKNNEVLKKRKKRENYQSYQKKYLSYNEYLLKNFINLDYKKKKTNNLSINSKKLNFLFLKNYFWIIFKNENFYILIKLNFSLKMIKEKLFFFLNNLEFHFQKKVIFNDKYLNKLKNSNFEINNFKKNGKMNLKIFLEKNTKRIKNIIKKIDLSIKVKNVIKKIKNIKKTNKFDIIKKKLKLKKKLKSRNRERRNSYNIQNKLRFEKLYQKNLNLKIAKKKRSSFIGVIPINLLKRKSTIILEEDENSGSSSFFEKNESIENSEKKNIFEKTVFAKNGNIIDNVNYLKNVDIIKKKYNFFNYNKNSLKFKKLENGDIELIIYK